MGKGSVHPACTYVHVKGVEFGKGSGNEDPVFNVCCSCVTHLLRNLSGSSPFTVDSSGFTPLHYAASSGHKMAIQMVSTITEGGCPKGCGMRSPWSFLAFGLCTRRHLGYSCRRYQDHTPSSCCELVCACTHVEVTIVCAGVSWTFWCPGGTVVQVPGLY